MIKEGNEGSVEAKAVRIHKFASLIINPVNIDTLTELKSQFQQFFSITTTKCIQNEKLEVIT